MNKEQLEQKAAEILQKHIGEYWYIMGKHQKEAIAAMLEMYDSKDEWVAVSERLPEYMECVICYTVLGIVTEGQYTGTDNLFTAGEYEYAASHWMPLPTPPQSK